ncbi:MAG TPA: aldolase/citrate lyase family protein [Chloroflexota bacterium]|jgi:4-hydroxy-2-oxoheptanedioate aldolase|nr:aldolase/citrate lyase family protein [Chloroflexota bacterium]
MRRNRALAKLRDGRVISGPILSFDSPSLAEQLAHLGFDFVWLDWQHGQWAEHTLNDALARFLATESTPLVRVKGHEPGTINRVLDMGAMGVVVPYVQDAAQARAAVQAAYYPPRGIRSGGGVRLGLIGDSSAEYLAQANDEIMVGVMLETEAAIARAEEIMTVPGVSFALIGPSDLMIDVKANGHDEAEHERLVLHVAEVSKRTGVPAGNVCRSKEDAQRRIAQGFRFINYSSDGAVLLAGMRQLLADARDW